MRSYAFQVLIPIRSASDAMKLTDSVFSSGGGSSSQTDGDIGSSNIGGSDIGGNDIGGLDISTPLWWIS